MSVLKVKSENQIQADQISKVLAETGMNDINSASVLLTLLETNAQELFQQYVQLVNIVRNYNLDSTTGSDLDARAFEYGLTRTPSRKATGKITIQRPSTFVKASSSLYSGLPAPVVGDTVLRVNDASSALYGTSGTLIVGRGTSNEEQVTYSLAPVNNTNYWQFITSPFSTNHGLDESVILRQGTDATIPAGTTVSVPAAGSSPEIKFTVDHDTVLLAGESEVDNVEITAAVAGSSGNIQVMAITDTGAFPSPPFAGARAHNDSKFTTGADLEIDESLRNRIKNHIQSLSKATKTALLNAIIGLVDSGTAKRVVSSNIVLPLAATDPVKVYIDDGTGFEPSFLSRGSEILLSQATGGEKRLQLDLAPLVKANVESVQTEPFNMSSGNLTLTYQVGLQTETITFFTSDFTFPTSVSADQLVTLINNRATLIEARTSQGGKSVVVSALTDTNEDIQITGGTANAILGFPTDSRSTLYLYVDDALLSKDGATAFLDSGNPGNFNFSSLGASPWPLTLVIDGKTANSQTVSFVTGDFVDPTAGTPAEVITAINSRLCGATACVITGNKIRIASNQTLSAASQVRVTGGSANTLFGFSTVNVVGSNRDYTLNRELGTIELVKPLVVNQTASAASNYTRARLTAVSPESYSITSGQTLVVTVDGAADQTITFGATSAYTAAQVAALINAQLVGAVAIVRTIGSTNYLELNTNTYDKSTGSIKVKSTSTATALNFPLDVVKSNQRPHRAFLVSGSGGPFAFTLGKNLVVVLDNNPASETFTIQFDFSGTVTTGTSATQFSALALNTVFSNTSDLVGYWVIAKSGPNTVTGTVSTITNTVSNTWRYAFSALPASLSTMAAGDHVTFTGMQQTANNGNFLVTAVNTTGNGYIEIVNPSGVLESGSAGTALIGQRRTISAHVGSTGAITVSSGFSSTFGVGNTFAVLPATIQNTVAFFNNKKVSTLSTKAFIEASTGYARIQISSQKNGADGYVQVTGGSANPTLVFSTALVRGLQAYNYYTGLLKEVHRTIYGDDQDLITFEGVGAAGIPFQVLSPTKQEISFNINVTLAQGVSISNVGDDIKSAITGYVNSLGVGDDMVLATIIQRIMEVNNVIDVDVVSPTGNVVIADNELARTSDANISLG